MTNNISTQSIIQSIVDDCKNIAEMEQLYQSASALEQSGEAWFDLSIKQEQIESPFHSLYLDNIALDNLELHQLDGIDRTTSSYCLEFSSNIGQIFVSALELKRAIRLVKKYSINHSILKLALKTLNTTKKNAKLSTIN
jgi:hypothetical protein